MRIQNAILVAVVTSSPALALPTHVDNIPNGAVVAEGSTRSCQHCHVNSGGGEGWNELGKAFLEQGDANPDANPTDQNLGYTGEPDWNADICNEDSDGDGFSNGEELGDPNCIWSIGDTPEITDGITNAGDADSFPGGDNTPPPPGDGGGDDPLTCNGGTPAPVIALLGLVALLRRRRR
jgi:uncharacterized protein (TIGR03382 family)